MSDKKQERNATFYKDNKEYFKKYYKDKNKNKIYCEDCQKKYCKSYYQRHLKTLQHKLNSKYCFIDDNEKLKKKVCVRELLKNNCC